MKKSLCYDCELIVLQYQRFTVLILTSASSHERKLVRLVFAIALFSYAESMPVLCFPLTLSLRSVLVRCTPRPLDALLGPQRRGFRMKHQPAGDAAGAPRGQVDHAALPANLPSDKYLRQNDNGAVEGATNGTSVTDGGGGGWPVGSSLEAGGPLLENGAEDPIFRTSSAEGVARSYGAGGQATASNGTDFLQYQASPSSNAVPAWLGQGSMSSRRRTGSASPARGAGATDKRQSGDVVTTATGGTPPGRGYFEPETPLASADEHLSEEENVFGPLEGGLFDPDSFPPEHGRVEAEDEAQEEDVLDWLKSGSVV